MKNRKLIIAVTIILVLLITVIAVKLAFEGIEANLEQLRHQEAADLDMTSLADGTYRGSYKAFPIEAEVEAVVENHKIRKIILLKHKNGQGKAAEVITDRVVAAQALDVEAVSGATYSSKVILKAIENALGDD